MTSSIKNTILALSLVVLSVGYSLPANAGSASAVEAIAAAKTALKKAESVGGAWRDTGKMIKKAEKLLADGKEMDAASLANEAEAQGMLGYEQSVSQTVDNLHI